MSLPYYIVNAFTELPFGGNPAAVMPLDHWLPDHQLQALAAQHNLSETAFFVPVGASTFELRWFTPVEEVPLCGHATLATAHVLLREMQVSAETLSFQTRFRGLLHAEAQGDRLTLDFPAVEYEPHTVEAGLEAALGARVVSAVRPCDEPWQILYELDGETSVRTLKPNISALAAIAEHCVIVTAGSDQYDFVSRMFAPHYDVPEDPVTGSAHCLLTPFWSDRLAKQHLLAHQSSARGGTLWCERRDDRIFLSGHAMTFAKGRVTASL